MPFQRIRLAICIQIIFDHYEGFHEVKIDYSFHLHHCIVFEELELFIPQIAVNLLDLCFTGRASHNLDLKITFAFWKSLTQLFFFRNVSEDLLG